MFVKSMVDDRPKIVHRKERSEKLCSFTADVYATASRF
jgi:hypothetical protein